VHLFRYYLSLELIIALHVDLVYQGFANFVSNVIRLVVVAELSVFDLLSSDLSCHLLQVVKYLRELIIF
jgi:hypothetical protein